MPTLQRLSIHEQGNHPAAMTPFIEAADGDLPSSGWFGKEQKSFHGTDAAFAIQAALTAALNGETIKAIDLIQFTRYFTQGKVMQASAEAPEKSSKTAAIFNITTSTNRQISIYLNNTDTAQTKKASSNVFISDLIADQEISDQGELTLNPIEGERRTAFNQYAKLKPEAMYLSTILDAAITASQMLALKNELPNNNPKGSKFENIKLGKHYQDIANGGTLTIEKGETKNKTSKGGKQFTETPLTFTIKNKDGSLIASGEFYWINFPSSS